MRKMFPLLASAAVLSLAVSACATKDGDTKAVSTTTTTEKSATTGDGESSTTTTSTTTTEPAATTSADDAATTTSTTQTTTTTDPTATGADAAQTTTSTTKTTTTGAIRVATTADIKVGAPISDSAGVTFGKVEAVDADGVTINSGTARAKLPLSSVGVGPKGLVISITKAEFESATKAGG